MGSFVHCAVLEKDELEKRYFVLDLDERPVKDKDFRNTENKQWKIQQYEYAAGKTVVDSEMNRACQNMVTSLYEDEESRRLITEAEEKEKILKWKYAGLKFTGIEDLSGEKFIADLKTCGNAEPNKARRDMWNHGYYRQGGMYLDGEMNGDYVGDPHKRVYFIYVETVEPYCVSVHELQEEVIATGLKEYRMLAQELKSCIDNDQFPGYSYRTINGTFDVYIPAFMNDE